MTSSSSDLYLGFGSVVIAITIFVAAEVISLIIGRTAKVAGARPSVIRDIKTAIRLIAVFLIVSQVLQFTGLASEFTTLTISGVTAIAVSLALQTTLSNIISGVLLFNDGVIRLNDTIEYSGTK